ncbi:MAG TPA: PA2779 family protein, partial [Burkholderiales bacterium]|nr:PA2779 family protein [Burkholderiales bacterium]
EVAQLAAQIDSLPAGGDSILGLLVLVFVILLITDILGLTKIFPFTRPIR